MIPQTIIELHDNSFIKPVFKDNSTPLFMMGFSSDKGDESIRRVQGEDFYKIYGKDISFKRHGQPLLQAANIIYNGGVIIAKRVVAEDATLANVAVVAKIKKESVQKKNEKGELLYTDSVTGKETTTAGSNKPLNVNIAKITYLLQTTKNIKNMKEIISNIGSLLNDKGDKGEYIYPLMIMSDIGRGVSRKKFRINPDYAASRNFDYIKYNINIIEDDTVLETTDFAFKPDVVEKGENMSLQTRLNYKSKQVRCKVFDDNCQLFINKVAELSDNTIQYCAECDLLFAQEKHNLKANNIELVETKDTISNLSYVYGIPLESGSNGNFGDAPFGKDEYTEQLVKLFNGTFDNNIYDYDNYSVDVIVDANYPEKVKRTIENYVTFREDILYFRDLGLGMTSITDIMAKIQNPDMLKNRYCATYYLSYDIIDPFTKRQESVTIGYSLAKLLINHFLNGRNRPFAGQLYSVCIPEAIEGTASFIPKITPAYNEKKILIENKVNYVSYYDGLLTVETLYSSQEKDSQFSFLNNVLAIQEVIKAVRLKCPKIRYSFMNGKDLENYKKEIQTVLDSYSDGFRELTMTYVEDKTMLANKVFYATIAVKFKDFVQTEYFKIYAFN